MAESTLNWKKKPGGKGEIVCYKQFLLFPQCFKRFVMQTRKNQGLFGKGLMPERESQEILRCVTDLHDVTTTVKIALNSYTKIHTNIVCNKEMIYIPNVL